MSETGTPGGNILLVDYNTDLLDKIASAADPDAFRLVHASRIQEGLDRSASAGFDIVIVRDCLPDGRACDILPRLSAGHNPPAVIVISSDSNPRTAEEALRKGAWEFITESESVATLVSSLRSICEYRRQADPGKHARRKAEKRPPFKQIVGHSPEIQHCLDMVLKAGPSDVDVLIVGESGTGKELIAHAIHSVSPYADREMVVIDCASLPDNLVESILFGHVRGAFTGADRASEGLIRQAHGTTLFLDEIGELSLDIQKKFLRVLQERQLRPVGGRSTLSSDFRLIAATNRDLARMVELDLFREDLFFRLKTVQIELPPLRKRSDDITELAYFFMNQYCKAGRIRSKKFSPAYLIVLRRYSWPGNIRELENVIRYSVTMATESDILLPIHLPTAMRINAISNHNRELEEKGILGGDTAAAGQRPPTLQEARKAAIEQIERKYLLDLLRSSGGDMEQACATAGLSRSRLYALLQKYKLPAS